MTLVILCSLRADAGDEDAAFRGNQFDPALRAFSK